MKAEELRIGNWVEIDQYGNTRNVIRIDNGTEIDQVIKLRPTPIQLTPEILEKCGIKDVWIKNSWKIVEDVSGGESFGWAMKVRNANHDKEIEFAYFKYLHQLQNLFFCLCGEELTFKP